MKMSQMPATASQFASPSLATFLSHKALSLRTDKSYKSSWDAPLMKLLGFLNESKELYSVSSCSGRVSLMRYEGESEEKSQELQNDASPLHKKSVQKKYDASFGFVSHDVLSQDEDVTQIWDLIQEAKAQKATLWFQQEPVIIHIRARHMHDAMHLVHLFKTWGYKRSGLNTIKNQKFVIWVASTEEVKTVLVRNGEVLVNERYLEVLVEESNKRLLQTHSKIHAAEVGLLSWYMEGFSEAINAFWFDGIKRKHRRETPAPVCKKKEQRERLTAMWTEAIHCTEADASAEWPHLPLGMQFIARTLGDHVKMHGIHKHDWALAMIIYLDQYVKRHTDGSTTSEDETPLSVQEVQTTIDQILTALFDQVFMDEVYVPIERLFFYVAAARSPVQSLRTKGLQGLDYLSCPRGDMFVFPQDRADIFCPFLTALKPQTGEGQE